MGENGGKREIGMKVRAEATVSEGEGVVIFQWNDASGGGGGDVIHWSGL